jgi:TolA-binding protein
MRSIVFLVIVLYSCSTAIAEQDKNETDLNNKKVVAKDDDFAAIMLRSKNTSTFAFSAANKADKAVGNKIDITVQKIDNLETQVENLIKTNEELKTKANSIVIESYVIEPIIDSTISQEDN